MRRFTRIMTPFMILAVLLMAGCTSNSKQSTAPNKSETPAPSGQNSNASATKEHKKPYKIALSNSYIGNSWRVEMVAIWEAYAEKKYKGTVEASVVNTGNDAQAQIASIQNMISQGVDAIVINAASPTALDPVIKEAVDKGIVVVTFDNTVTSPLAINVNTDQLEWGRKSAEWLAKAIGGKGNIVMINGVKGTTVDQERNKGAKEIFAKYPDIKILGEANGNWDEATGQQVMASMLTAYPKIDGIWTQGGADSGVVKALLQAKRPLVPMTGEMLNGYLKQLKEMKGQGLKGIAIGQPPFLSASSLDVAVQALEGKKFSDNKVWVPLPIATSDDVDKWILAEQPDSFFVAFSSPEMGLKADDILKRIKR